MGTGNNATGCEIWRYDGGTSWTRVDGGVSPGNGGFGDPNNDQVWNMVNLGGQLYAAINNPTTGCEIWRYDGGTSWTRVDGGVSPGNGGFGNPNNVNAELAVYKNMLYAGVWNGTEGCEVWRYDGGTSWTCIASGGFGDVNNTQMFHHTLHNNRLYYGVTNQVTGGEIWEFDGTDWTQCSTGGFGVSGNISVSTVCSYNGALYGGTTNAALGTQVWRNTPRNIWYLAEGATEGGFETWVLVQNPGTDPVHV
ncbi:MAG: hypothetical protein JW854_10720, partial [Actinobacteria bacterium]|nr:hypothetical protein [Actinomycetota bacterium]